MMINELIQGYTFRVILENAAILGAVAGVLGVFISVKKHSVLMSVSSHAALVGMLISVVITGARTSSVMMVSAAVFCLISVGVIKIISHTTNLNRFILQSLITSIYFGVCMVIFAYLRLDKDVVIAGLNKYLLGETATLLKNEINISIYVCSGILIICLLLIKRIKSILFDYNLARTTKIPANFYRGLIFLMTVAITVVGIQTVGILLMGALFITPAVAARFWAGTFIPMALTAGLIGGVSGMAGGLISGATNNISTGPAIITVAGAILLFSLLFAPNTGLIWKKRNKYLYTPLDGIEK